MSSTHSRNLSLKTFSTFAVLWICLLLCVTAMPVPLQAQAPFLAETQQPEKVRLLVKTAKGLSQGQAQAALKGKGASVKKSIPGLDLHIIEVSANAADNIINAMKGDAQIVRVETDRPRKWQSTPSDTQYPDQWALPKISWDQVFGNANPAYDTKVAILDTGIDATHPDLAGVVVAGTSILEGGDPNVDENGHGTWLAGIVAARTDNQQGIAGVGYSHVQVMPVKVLGTDGIGWDSDIIQGVQYAVQNGASVILMAFSAEGYSEALQDAIDDAWQHNVVIVAAAGNSGSNTPTFPAGDRGVIGVSATDPNDALATGSTFGPSVFLAAPGVNIPGPYPDNTYVVFSGTSGSAAIVAGTAALMRAIDPTLTNGMVVNRIAESADVAGTQEQTGNGRVNLARAVSDTSTNEIQPAGTTPFGNGGPFVGPYRIAARSFTINFLGNGTGSVTITSSTPLNVNTSQCIGATGDGTTTVKIFGSCPSISSMGGVNSYSVSLNAVATTGSFAGWSNGTSSLLTCSNSPATNPCAATVTANSSLDLTISLPNDAPVINRDNASVTATEGQTATNTGTWSDANAGDTVTLSASVGSVTKSGTNSGGTWSWSLATTDNAAPQTITISANDGTVTTTTTFSVTINNANPVVTAAANQSTAEGNNNNWNLASFADAGGTNDKPWAIDVNWGDGSSHTTFNANGLGDIGKKNHGYADNGTYTVTVTITDKDLGSGSASFIVTINNVAPTATLGNNGPINEGGSATVTFTAQADPSTADTAAGFHYAYSCTNGSLAAATYASAGTSASTSCTFTDSATSTVRARIIDKDDGFTEYTTNVIVNNVPPTATFAGPTSANEGEPKTYSFTAQADVSSDDTAAGFHYAYSCTGASLAGATYAGSGTSDSTNCSFPDNGSFTVRARIIDKDGGFNEYTVAVTVANVAPTATLGNNGPVNEGSPATITFSGQFDASTADTTAGFHYAYSCTNGDLSGSTYAASGTSATNACTFNDNGSYPVKARIIDKDGGFTEYTTSVTVNNVAPTATLSNSGPINEGSSATISFSSQLDPSSADTSAGFHYAFSCTNGDLSGETYAGSGTTANTSCNFTDNGTKAVKARIIDKDGGFTEYTTNVTVNNVAPTASFAGVTTANEGETKVYTFSNQADVSSDDIAAGFHYAYSCTGGSLAGSTYAGSGSTTSVNCAFPDNGTFSVTARIIDKDNGATEYVVSVTVDNVAPTATLGSNSSVNEGSPATITFSNQSDVAADLATLHYAYSCTNGDLSGATYAGSSASASTSCTFNDNGSNTVKARVIDKDGGYNEYTTSVVVNNVAPTASLSNNGPINEGSSATISFSGQLDPSSVDTAAGFRYAYSCSNGDLSAATYAASSTTASTSCSFDDNGTKTVKARIIDKDGGYNEYTTSVVVNNVAPTATFNTPPGAVNEGASFNLSLTGATDVSSVDQTAGFNYAFDCGTGYGAFGPSSTVSCTAYDNPGVTVKGKVQDKDGGETEYTGSVTINNVAPTATFNAPPSVNEGSAIALSLTAPVDGPGDVAAGFKYAFDCGAGYGAFSTTSTASCSTTDNGSVTVKGKIRDKDYAETEYTTSVTVNNVAPTASLSNNGPVNEGSSASINFSGQLDPSSDDTLAGFRYAFNCSGGSISAMYATAGASASASCMFPDSGSKTVSGRIIDKDNGYTDYTTVVTVNNVAPTVTAPANQASTEGALASFSLGSFTDPGADNPWQVSVNWGDGSTNTTFIVSATGSLAGQTHNYLDNGQYTVTVSVTDKDGAAGSKTFTVSVANVAPVITSTTGPTGPVALTVNTGTPVNLAVNFTDPGVQDSHTCTFSWDDGTANTTMTAPGLGSGSCTITHPFKTGVYTVVVTVVDKDGGTIIGTIPYIVVYDPNAGFVTGGGWINSPAGAFRADQSLTGKANFGFVSKYEKGKNVPTGETEFQFQVGNLSFHSTVYEWLVVSGPKAQYKGSGTINGIGNYGFLLTATDGDVNGGGGVDRFRIKIIDGDGGIIYDNNYGASDDIDTANPQAIANGSIVIHSSNK